MVKIRVLGKYSPYPKAGGSCSGYWVTSGGNGILLDCGPGVISSFGRFEPLSRISTVILSHLHFDHISDFLALRYVAVPDQRYKELPKKIRVFAPAKPEREFSLLSYKEGVEAVEIPGGLTNSRHIINYGCSGGSSDFGDLADSIYSRDSGDPVVSQNHSGPLMLNGFKVSFYQVEHSGPSYAVRLEDESGAVLAYSGDTRPCKGLLEAAKGADLFLCEASAIEADAEFAKPGHLTARQAGEIAGDAGVSRLLLTHIWPLYDETVLLKECQDVFKKSEIVVEGKEYTVLVP